MKPSSFFSLSLTAFATLAAQAQTPLAPVPNTTIEVTGVRPGDSDVRRDSTAPTLVFGRDELDRQGDASVLDVMKRLPGVTLPGRPGRGGGPQMRGMGSGYTQLLINGEPAPRGMSLDSITPDQVERIEVTRSATAERGTRGVAGTINIVLREELRKQRGETRIALESEAGQLQTSAMGQYSDRLENFGYNLSANVTGGERGNAEYSLTTGRDPVNGATILSRAEDAFSSSRTKRANLNARLNWRLAPGETLNLQPVVSYNESNGHGSVRLQQTVGRTPQEWVSAASSNESSGRWTGISGDWQTRLSGGRFEIRANTGEFRNASHSSRIESDATAVQVRSVDSDNRAGDGRFGASAKYSSEIFGGHTLVTGLELESGWRRETARTFQNGKEILLDSGDSFSADTQRIAAFAQDDWEISPSWAINAGLRWERIDTDVSSLAREDNNTSAVFSPVLHSVWRLNEEKRNQIRASLARTYRQANLGDLIARPRPNLQFPVEAGNDATHPDRIGNPALKPEVAWGLDLAFEHFMAGGGLLSANGFVRRIDDLIRNVTRLETVYWSPYPRWLTRPDNIGSAWSWGIELEAKTRLNQLLENAPPIDVRANLSRFWSRVDGVPGPDNRIDQQPKLTANLGADYRLKSLPIQIGGSLNWTPAYDVRRFDGEFSSIGVKRVAEAFAVWTITPTTRLRVSGSNLLAEDYLSSTRRILGGFDQTIAATARTDTQWAMRLELRL